MDELPAIRRACQPIATWWDHYLATHEADPDRLDEALDDARTLGPVSGRLGDALVYILDGCLPDLNWDQAVAAFERVAAVGRGASLEAAEHIGPQPPPPRLGAAHSTSPKGEQLTFPGITTTPSRHRS